MRIDQDRQLWLQIAKGDEQAFNNLFDSLVGYLYNYGLSITQDRSLIEDSIQDIFVELWNKREHIKIENSPKYYILVSFRRKLLKELKSNQYISLNADEHITSDKSQETKIIESETHTLRTIKIEHLQEYLSPRQREAIFLKFYEAQNSQQIADIMDIDIKGVYKLISQALIRLKKHYK